MKRLLSISLATVFAAPVADAETLGLQLYSLRNQLEADAPAALAQVAEWGLTSVEGGGNLYGMTADGFRDELNRLGLSLPSVDTNFEELRDNPMAVVYKARFYGAEFATFYWIPHDGNRGFGEADARAAIEVMNAAGPLLSDHGITLQYHVHGYEFIRFGEGTLFDLMAAEVTGGQFQMDVYWVRQGGADPLELLQAYPGRWTSLHLKDRAHGTPDTTTGHSDVETNVVLGQGDVGIAGVVAEARRQGIEYWFIEDESSRVLEQVPASLRYLDTLLPIDQRSPDSAGQ